ncbi:MAG: SseB family protein, partial [Clostridia bacterium]|nr:SseB family protein [Clostridia bacterium]
MKKFILIAVCLLLVALLTLGVCMYAIGESKAESKPYDMGETVSVAPEDTPTAQEEMEQKFSVYNHVTEENGKKILTLFSEEQAEEQWTKRENGEEFRLTYDEILFIISDSQRLYETYDEIILTNASEYGVAATEHEE